MATKAPEVDSSSDDEVEIEVANSAFKTHIVNNVNDARLAYNRQFGFETLNGENGLPILGFKVSPDADQSINTIIAMFVSDLDHPIKSDATDVAANVPSADNLVQLFGYVCEKYKAYKTRTSLIDEFRVAIKEAYPIFKERTDEMDILSRFLSLVIDQVAQSVSSIGVRLIPISAEKKATMERTRQKARERAELKKKEKAEKGIISKPRAVTKKVTQVLPADHTVTCTAINSDMITVVINRLLDVFDSVSVQLYKFTHELNELLDTDVKDQLVEFKKKKALLRAEKKKKEAPQVTIAIPDPSAADAKDEVKAQ